MALAIWQATITDQAGNIQGGASIEVRAESDNSLVSLYSDRDGMTPLGNPFTADSSGYAAFHVVGGAYKITANKGGFGKTWRYVGIGTAAEADADDIGGSASSVAFTPTGSVAATDVQAAIEEVDSEKMPKAGGTFTGAITVNGQIVFPASQNASSNANTLDDYEEGTYTPALTGSTGDPTITYTVQTGVYTKIGNSIRVKIVIVINTTSSGSGDVRIALPFACSSAGNDLMTANTSGVDWPASMTTMQFVTIASQSYGVLVGAGDNAVQAAQQISGLAGTDIILVAGTFNV